MRSSRHYSAMSKSISIAATILLGTTGRQCQFHLHHLTAHAFFASTSISTPARSFQQIQTNRRQKRHATFQRTVAPLRQSQSQSQQINGQSTNTNTITQTMEKTSLRNYEDLMDHFMFELGNDITFLQTHAETSAYIHHNFDTILFDCDGVLYRGTDPIPDAGESIKSLMKGGKRCLFVTNNAGSNRRELRDKLTKVLGLEEGALSTDDMVCASYSATRYLAKEFERTGRERRGGNVHVIGTGGLCEELENAGFQVTGGPNRGEKKSCMSREELASYDFGSLHPNVDAVVVGLDTEFDYRKLCIANVLLQRNPDAILIATNMDAYDLVGEDGRHLPGNGSLVRAVEHASGREAANVGKPSGSLVQLLREDYGLGGEDGDLSRVLMVGDRLDTDVRFGKDGGMKSALVLTGCTDAKKVIEVGDGTEEEPLPHIIFPHMGLMGL